MARKIWAILILSVAFTTPAIARSHHHGGGGSSHVNSHRGGHANMKHHRGDVYPLEGQFDSKGRQVFRTRH